MRVLRGDRERRLVLVVLLVHERVQRLDVRDPTCTRAGNDRTRRSLTTFLRRRVGTVPVEEVVPGVLDDETRDEFRDVLVPGIRRARA